MAVILVPGQAIRTLTIAGDPVTSAIVGSPYDGFTVTADGGETPYVFSLAQGLLPNGIALGASSGIVAGTPTTEGDYTGIVIRVTDAGHRTADLASFDIGVLPAPPPGFAYVVDENGAFVVDEDGNYVIQEI